MAEPSNESGRRACLDEFAIAAMQSLTLRNSSSIGQIFDSEGEASRIASASFVLAKAMKSESDRQHDSQSE